MLRVIGALSETAISNLLGAVTNLLKEKADFLFNADDDLKKLEKKLENFQKAIKAADRKPFLSNERDRDLEGDLKDVLYDAEDIIEEYRSKIEVSKKNKGSTSTNKVRKQTQTIYNEHVSYPLQLGNQIKKINERLDEIPKDWVTDLLKPKPKESSQGRVEVGNPRETTYHIDAQPPIGRGNDKRVIVEKLLSNGSEQSSMTEKRDVSIISIVGEGGIGKTTLAKMVFNEVEPQFGERRWWVCVFERSNGKDLLRKILKEVCKEPKEGDDTSLNYLCTQIQSELEKKRFLLVLDDLWELDWWHGEVQSTLMRGAMGGKILITSRNIEVSKGVRALYMHRLPILTEDESWKLFLNKASKTEHELKKHKLQDIAKIIIKKCSGLPLVVQTVGSLMQTKSMKKVEWKMVADSVIWEWKMPASSSSSQYGSILPGLILSYDDLPPYLGSCFVYCSIFPKDHEIKREGLIMQWVAHGLIEENEGIDVEVTANQYLEDLIRRCLIEETHDRFYGGTHLKLHDILHDLASYIGGKEYSHASATEQTRHLSLLGVDDAEAAMKYNASGVANKVRTLLSASLSSVEFTNFKWLRVLSLRECRMDELPKSIECLSLLKYLDLSASYVKRLPSSIGKLCNLQTLDLSYSKIEEMPKEMGELCNLRYLGLKDTKKLEFIAEGLGKLTNLQTLHKFLVCDDKGDTRGCNIRELENLNKLKGELLIEGLGGGRVKVFDAEKAQLKEKHELNGVELNFKVGEDDKVDRASEQRGLLEALEPPHDIERLRICDYVGDRPAWYLETNYEELRALELQYCPLLATVIGIKSMEKLKVEGCNMLKTLANMPALESLEVIECCSLEQVAEMPALRSLKISGSTMHKTLANMPALESLEVIDCGSLEQVGDDHMPALKKLRLSDLNTLKQLPTSLPSLEDLTLYSLANWEGWPVETTFTSMPCLRAVDFNNCPKMRTEGWIDELMGHDSQATQLQKLTVLYCPNARLGRKLLQHLSNLIQLTLDGTALESTLLPSEVSTFLPSLKALHLKGTNSGDLKWGKVPDWVWALSQLEILFLKGFTEDISLGGHWQCLPKLRDLMLDDFSNLKSLVDVNNVTPQQNETTFPMNAQHQIACLSKLDHLSIFGCPALGLPQELRDRLGERLNIYQ